MITDREAIMTALVAVLSGVAFSAPVSGRTTFVSVSRRLKLWADVPKSQRPALFITEHHEAPTYQSETLPQKNTMLVELFVYIDSSDKNSVPASALNVIMNAIDKALAPTAAMGGKQTLGVLGVSHCRIEGQVLKDPGDLDGDGLLWIPLKILAT